MVATALENRRQAALEHEFRGVAVLGKQLVGCSGCVEVDLKQGWRQAHRTVLENRRQTTFVPVRCQRQEERVAASATKL